MSIATNLRVLLSAKTVCQFYGDGGKDSPNLRLCGIYSVYSGFAEEVITLKNSQT